MNLSFSNPKYLFLLFIIPLFIFFHFVSLKSRNKRALKFANFTAISRIKGIDLFSKNIITLILSCIILILLVFSIAGTTIHVTKDITDFTFVIAIDTSSSMSANDFQPNRMEFAKVLSKELIDIIPSNTKIGLVSFGAYSIIEQDLTRDKAELKSKIDPIWISNVGGTGFYEVVVTSSNLLFKEDAKSLILLSDGQATIGDVESAIRYATNNNLIINTIAIGSEVGGEAVYGVSKLDKETLKALSYQTGGLFIEGENKEAIKESFKEILALKGGIVDINISFYLIITSIILFVIECLLINLKYACLP